MNEFAMRANRVGRLKKVSSGSEYNWDNRTAKISADGKSYAYEYDVLGRRIKKSLTAGTELTENVSMFFDGDDAYQEYSVSGERTAEYMFSGRIDEPLLVTKGGQEYTYHQNHLGTVMGLSDDNGNLENIYQYTAYGTDREFVENINQPYQYTGREAVGNTGLYYYRSRMMRSRNGAFTRQDDAIDGVNWRGYVRGNPIIFSDPTGYVYTDTNPATGIQTPYVDTPEGRRWAVHRGTEGEPGYDGNWWIENSVNGVEYEYWVAPGGNLASADWINGGKSGSEIFGDEAPDNWIAMTDYQRIEWAQRHQTGLAFEDIAEVVHDMTAEQIYEYLNELENNLTGFNDYFDCMNNIGASTYCLENIDNWSEENYQEWLTEQPIVDADNDGVDDNTGYVYDQQKFEDAWGITEEDWEIPGGGSSGGATQTDPTYIQYFNYFLY